MTQPPTGSSALERRGCPNLHVAWAKHWPALMTQSGFYYLGNTARAKTARSPAWRPERILAIDAQHTPTIYSNACVHGGMQLIPSERGLHFHAELKISCPWHRFSYATKSGIVLRPGTMPIECKALPERRCERSAQYVWQGLVFELGQDAETTRYALDNWLRYVRRMTGNTFNFEEYDLHTSASYDQNADKLSSEINYLDIWHLSGHPDTLAPLVATSQYTSTSNGSVVIQTMGFNPRWLASSDLWAKLYRKMYGERQPLFGAIWVTFPNGFMLEWYPGVIVVSQCFPDPSDWRKCVFHHDFYYARGVSQEFIDAHQVVFKKTGVEDEVWCHHATRRLETLILEGRGSKNWGVFHPEQEDYGHWYYQMVEKQLREHQTIVLHGH